MAGGQVDPENAGNGRDGRAFVQQQILQGKIAVPQTAKIGGALASNPAHIRGPMVHILDNGEDFGARGQTVVEAGRDVQGKEITAGTHPTPAWAEIGAPQGEKGGDLQVSGAQRLRDSGVGYQGAGGGGLTWLKSFRRISRRAGWSERWSNPETARHKKSQEPLLTWLHVPPSKAADNHAERRESLPGGERFPASLRMTCLLFF